MKSRHRTFLLYESSCVFLGGQILSKTLNTKGRCKAFLQNGFVYVTLDVEMFCKQSHTGSRNIVCPLCGFSYDLPSGLPG